MQHTKQQIVNLLRRNGGLTAADLSAALGISTTAVRRHLDNLEARSVIVHRLEQRGLGRPSHIYHTSDRSTRGFDQSFAAFAQDLIQELHTLDGEQSPDALFDLRHTPRRRQYVKLTEGETLAERVASLAQLMDAEGRLATWQQLDLNHFVLRQHNCPFRQLDTKYGQPCQCELALLREALDANVQQISRIRNGGVACAFKIVGKGVEESTHVQELSEVFFRRVTAGTYAAAA